MFKKMMQYNFRKDGFDNMACSLLEKYDTQDFRKDLEALGVSLQESQIESFLIYYEMLVEWNRVMNLTGITEYYDVFKKHFVDSLSLVNACDVAGKISVIDVGTGAGFPGMVLKIAFPQLQLTLLDSLNKRIQFLNAVIDKLDLSGVETVHGRAEDLAKPGDLREKYDLCVSRAVANLATLSEYCLPFVREGGLFISYKSEKISEETAAAEHALSLLGGKIRDQVKFQLPNSDIYRNLVVIEKIKATPKRFPRKAGLPGKEPL